MIMKDDYYQELELSNQLPVIYIAASISSRTYGNESKSMETELSHEINKVSFSDTKLNDNRDLSHMTSLERGNTHCDEIHMAFDMSIGTLCHFGTN